MGHEWSALRHKLSLCSSCDRRLDNWYIQNRGRLYCRRDYLAKFKDACNGCSHVISGPVMVAGEHRFHPECFQCCLCQAFIGDGESYALVERSFLYWRSLETASLMLWWSGHFSTGVHWRQRVLCFGGAVISLLAFIGDGESYALVERSFLYW
ncbi:hypothetical protein RRG08_012375 [Elysia crispata]|uniref:LIM zinc-binding domain-containing protein n=1 Tax=Elysia crispata TaxID=231223 RepID=A0AAE0YHB6_9GAST|nr:hypothetical protein RRG08_012375 [Elysia crispata]